MTTGRWWRDAVFYQVYPRSFADSDGDGVGDLAGITAHLDHLRGGQESLGVDAIWLSPFYASPMADFGYDISDHCAIDPVMGTLADFDALVAAAHARGLKVIVDFVPNHTSDQHAWFVEARSSRSSRRREFYVWADPAPGGGPPNNWPSAFATAGDAWTFDQQTGQYYLHSYTPQQPDLNWRNDEVVDAMTGVLDFWLRRGVDGVRVDAIHRLGKDPLLRSNPPELAGRRFDHDPALPARLMHIDHPDVHEAVRAIRRTLDRHGGRVAVGEVGVADLRRLMRYYGDVAEPGAGSPETRPTPALDLGDGLHLTFVFSLWKQPWSASAFRRIVGEVEAALPAHGWPAYALSNHDVSRVATRLGGPDGAADRARVAATMLLTLRGAPFLYYGEEIGMTDVTVPPEQAADPDGRDRCRTPMQWTGGPGAGFTAGRPWLPVSPDAGAVNVAAQRSDPASLLSLYRALIRLRRSSPALRRGSYLACVDHPDVFAYRRRHEGEDVLVACNFSAGGREYADPALPEQGRRLLSTVGPARVGADGPATVGTDGPATVGADGPASLRPLTLRPLEATIIRLDR